MDLSVNVLNTSNIILSNNIDDTNGTNIEDLLRIRQEEEIEKLLLS